MKSDLENDMFFKETKKLENYLRFYDTNIKLIIEAIFSLLHIIV